MISLVTTSLYILATGFPSIPFNRTTVECKEVQQEKLKKLAEAFNRTTVECKGERLNEVAQQRDDF